VAGQAGHGKDVMRYQTLNTRALTQWVVTAVVATGLFALAAGVASSLPSA